MRLCQKVNIVADQPVDSAPVVSTSSPEKNDGDTPPKNNYGDLFMEIQSLYNIDI